MEQLIAIAERATSPIEALPAELLEQVLLYVVKDNVRPILDANYVHRDSRVQQSHVKSSLAFRHSCKKFYTCSWRALGFFLGETVFDIKSRASCGHLAAVAECKDLAPWVNKLTLACNQPLDIHPDYASPTEDSQEEELALIRREEASWFPAAWSRWSEEERSTPSSSVPSAPRREKDFFALQALITTVLSSLKNLSHMCYHHADVTPPGRYHRLIRTLRSLVTWADGELDFSSSAFIAGVGFELMT